jgi:cytoskeletal protein RodZ
VKFYYFEIATLVISLFYVMGLVLAFAQMTFDFVKKSYLFLIVVVFIAVTILGITFFGSWFNATIDKSILWIATLTSITGAMVGAVAINIYKSRRHNRSTTQSTASHVTDETTSTALNVLSGTVSTALNVAEGTATTGLNVLNSTASTALNVAEGTATTALNVVDEAASTAFSLLNHTTKGIFNNLNKLR